MPKICVLGLGYIGLPTASMFANNGFEVIGVDINDNIVNTINGGDIHIEEPGLKTLVQAAINSGKLVVAREPVEADAYIIAVPTPLTKDKKADLTYVVRAAESILPVLKKGAVVILESTIPPRTTMDMLSPILERTGLELGKELFVSHCPERVLPGRILKELVENSRIIGGINEESAKRAKRLYESFVEGEIFLTDATSAELVKLMENTFRDVNIALANELAQICYKLGVDVWEVIRLANQHPRVNIHIPGPGVGGHCLAVDPYFIVDKAPEVSTLIANARDINENMPDFVVNVVKEQLNKRKNARIAIFGAAYKGNVDDTRESPAIYIIDKLKGEGYQIKIFDPHVKHFKYEMSSLEETIENADLILVLTDHNDFKYLNPRQIGKMVRIKKIFDTKNCIVEDEWKEAGFEVEIIGRSVWKGNYNETDYTKFQDR